MAIEAAHYGEARRALTQDPIVQDMAHGLAYVPRSTLVHDDGTPRFEFMTRANAEYARRGGKGQAHMGAVAEALMLLRNGEN
jgi:hypothetical protein